MNLIGWWKTYRMHLTNFSSGVFRPDESLWSLAALKDSDRRRRSLLGALFLLLAALKDSGQRRRGKLGESSRPSAALKDSVRPGRDKLSESSRPLTVLKDSSRRRRDKLGESSGPLTVLKDSLRRRKRKLPLDRTYIRIYNGTTDRTCVRNNKQIQQAYSPGGRTQICAYTLIWTER